LKPRMVAVSPAFRAVQHRPRRLPELRCELS
jgi:hypothetical protein